LLIFRYTFGILKEKFVWKMCFMEEVGS